MRDTSERVAGTAKGNHQLRRRRTEEGGTRHGKPIVTETRRRRLVMKPLFWDRSPWNG